MDSIERKYDLFEATFRAKRKKLQDSNRGIWKGKLLESLEVVENGDDIKHLCRKLYGVH
jgi:hypothetical protein